MMQLRYSLLFCLCTALLFGQEKIIVNPNSPEITFENDIIDMGTYMQYDDESSRCEFNFVNTGKEPLIIEKCKGSCGCTVPECPKEPILPGESAVIKVNYDEKRVGSFNKSITITSNATNGTKVIKIKGKVIAADKDVGAPVKKQSNLAPKAK